MLDETYDPLFSFGGATPVPTVGQTNWNLGDIELGGSVTVAVIGFAIKLWIG